MLMQSFFLILGYKHIVHFSFTNLILPKSRHFSFLVTLTLNIFCCMMLKFEYLKTKKVFILFLKGFR